MFRRFWWIFPVMMPVAAALGMVIAAAVTSSLPKVYESKCVMEVRPISGYLVSEGETDSPFVEVDHLEAITSRDLLEAVVGKLDLTTRWGMDGIQAVTTLERIVEVEPIRGTDLISVRVRHTEPVDCRDIAREVANSYGAYRHGIGTRKTEESLHELGRAVRDQEGKIEEIRKVFIKLVRGPGGRIRRSGGEANDAFETRDNLHLEKAKLDHRLQSLLRYKDVQLMNFVSTIDLSYNNARTLYPQYLAAVAERKEMEGNELPADHPSVLAVDERIAGIRREFDETVVKIRKATEAQLDLVSKQIEEIYGAATAGSNEFKAQDYMAAKQEFDVEQEVLQKLKLKLIGEQIGRRIPHESVVIHDDPVIPEAPVPKNVVVNLVLGGVAGVLISPLLALPLMGLLNRWR